MSAVREPPRIARLILREGGHCYWCDTRMVVWQFREGETPPGNAATVDHLRDRFNPSRWQPLQRGEGVDDRIVASCYRCNQTRSRQVEKWCEPLIFEAVQKAGSATFEALCRGLYARGEPDIFFAVRAWATVVVKGGGFYRPDPKKYPPLPPVAPEEQGPRPWDIPLLLQQAAE